ncbi:MAG: phage minor head protein [Acinetobacter sp.]
MIEKNMIDALVQHQANAYRLNTGEFNNLYSLFRKESNKVFNQLLILMLDLSDAEKTALSQGRYTTSDLKEIKTLFDDLYSSVATTVSDTFALSAVSYALYEANFTAKLYGESVDLTGESIVKKAKSNPLSTGQLVDDVWKDLAEKVRKKAMYTVRQGIVNGNTTQQIITELKGRKVGGEYVGGIVEQSRSALEANVRTLRSHVANSAMMDTFSVLGFDFVKFLATLDGRVSKICSVTDSTVWPINSPNIRRPPLHINCRSVLLGTDKDGSMLGKRPFVEDNRPVSKIPKSEREGIIGQIDANTSFPQWFKTADSSFQLEWLGKKRYELYKNGGFELTKFIDPLGRQYTLKELEALDSAVFKRLGL